MPGRSWHCRCKCSVPAPRHFGISFSAASALALAAALLLTSRDDAAAGLYALLHPGARDDQGSLVGLWVASLHPYLRYSLGDSFRQSGLPVLTPPGASHLLRIALDFVQVE